jgi:adenylyltransferase/sulfurtransferase
MPVIPGKSACLRCLLDDQPAAGGETCDTSGIIMPAVLQAVAWATSAALKILSGNSDAVLAKMMTSDVWTGERASLDASTPRANCPACGNRQFEWLEGTRGSRSTVLCGRNSVQIAANGAFDFEDARQRIQRTAKVVIANDFLLRARYQELTFTLYRNGRAILHGTDDPSVARAMYARLVGQ